MIHLRWLLIFVLPVWLGLIILPFNTLAKPEDSVQFYFDNYGRADSKNKLVRRVHQVFEKMKLVADKRYHRLPQLAIVEGFDNSNDCLIIALPDGHIVLSKQALDIIYKNVSLTYGDTRAAFVLGHELAHLANDDHWHRAFLSITKNTPVYQLVVKNYRKNQGQEKEIEADDHGFIYAAMAGYPVDKLLVDDSHQQNFFVYWEQQTFRQVNNTHPHPEVRANLLQSRLQALLGMLPYFHFGVRLSHFERCDDGVYFLREFVQHFPGREVYNNLGICELQKARKALGKEAYLYWLPSILDVTTPVDNLSLPYQTKGEKNTLADEFLINAEEYFKSALDMEPSYLPANVNLAITAFYLGEIYQARAAIEKAHQLAPNDLEIQGLRLVILYEEGKQAPYVDMWPHIIQQLESLAQQPNAPLSIFYNMARLLELRKRTGANKIWQQLARQMADLPIPIRRIVCEKTDCPELPRQKKPKARWELPVKLGSDTSRNNPLRKWQKNQMRLYDLYEQIYQHPNGKSEVLAMRELVEMVVLKKMEHVTLNDLPDYCGQPLHQHNIVNGTLWSCDHWTALVIEEKVKEVWVVSTTDLQ
ncbi:M48 family metalloprotease [Candidatus Parabeggiatoa sp. HSG14]|uniref:M48 family metalloprotease n=1 Tax=Candidatus Parabeggiatoa sp. HSG14 TaxID=3055593 RepID=UPI0025A815E1|nr:M48 family metalloprotease [Thiotrichales bacterium HSG14]